MANYKELEGFSVQTLATDPDSPGWIGSIFYNSTEGTFKTVKPGGIAVATWASGPNLDGARYASRATGTSSAGLMVTGANGTPSPPSGYLSTSIEYDGTSWANPSTMNVLETNNRTAIGVQTAAITASGYQSPINSTIASVELYDGATWTTGTSVNSARSGAGGAGIQTSAAIFGGTPTALSPSNPATTYVGYTEIWNGTSWTEVNDLNTTRRSMSYFGATPSSTAISIGGARSPAPGVPSITLTNVETWNGTSWTETTDINTAREQESGGGAGTSQSDGIIFGGYVGPAGTANTEYYNGTSWTELNNLASARYGNVGFGSSSSAITAGNYFPEPSSNTTEVWTVPEVVINTLTTS